MRLLTITTYILLVSCGRTPNTNDLIGEWIGISTWEGSGLIFDFKTDNELFISAVGTDSTSEVNYTYDKSSIKLTVDIKGKQEVFGKVEKVTNDRLVIITDDSKRLEFIKIKNVKVNLTKNDLIERLKNSSWTSTYGQYKIRIDFLKSHRWDDNNQPYEAMVHYSFSSPYKEKEIWNIGEYKGKLFIFYTNHQTEQVTQQIIEVTPDKLVVVLHTKENVNQEQVIEKTKGSTNGLLDKLTEKNWTSIDQDTTFCHEWGQINIRDTDVKELQLILKTKMEFKFNSDNSYTSLMDGQVWRTGQWRTTSDGAYLVLDDERDKNNWLELRQENKNLVLEKLQKIKDGERDYKLYMLIIKLQ